MHKILSWICKAYGFAGHGSLTQKTRATRIIGVDAEAERKVTTIPSYTAEGDFFESKVRKGW